MGPSSPLRDPGWSEHGRDTMVAAARLNLLRHVRAPDPAARMAVDRADLWRARARRLCGAARIREAIPDANKQSPAALLEYVRDTLQKAQSKPLLLTDQRALRAELLASCCIAGSAEISVERPENLFFADNRYYPRNLRSSGEQVAAFYDRLSYGHRPSGRRSRPKYSQDSPGPLRTRAHRASDVSSRHSSPALGIGDREGTLVPRKCYSQGRS